MQKQRVILLWIYILSNIISTLIMINSGYLVGDFKGNYSIHIEPLIAALFFILLTIFLLNFIFKISSSINVSIYINNINYRKLDYIFLLLSIIYLYGCISGYYIKYDPTALANRPFWSSLIYFFIPFDYVLLIYAFFAIQRISKIYFINLFMLVFCYILGGRTGILLFIYPLINIYTYLYKGKIYFIRNIMIIIFGFSVYPFVRAFKLYYPWYLFQNNGNSFIDFCLDKIGNDYWGTYVIFFEQSFERFQHVSNLAFLISNDNVLKFIHSHDFYLFSGGKIGFFIDKIFNLHSNNEKSASNLFAYFINGRSDWQVNTSLLGLPIIDIYNGIFAIFIAIILIFISNFIAKLISSNRTIIELNWLLMIVFILHGWLDAYIAHTEALVVFVFILFLTRIKIFKNGKIHNYSNTL